MDDAVNDDELNLLSRLPWALQTKDDSVLFDQILPMFDRSQSTLLTNPPTLLTTAPSWGDLAAQYTPQTRPWALSSFRPLSEMNQGTSSLTTTLPGIETCPKCSRAMYAFALPTHAQYCEGPVPRLTKQAFFKKAKLDNGTSEHSNSTNGGHRIKVSPASVLKGAPKKVANHNKAKRKPGRPRRTPELKIPEIHMKHEDDASDAKESSSEASEEYSGSSEEDVSFTLPLRYIPTPLSGRRMPAWDGFKSFLHNLSISNKRLQPPTALHDIALTPSQQQSNAAMQSPSTDMPSPAPKEPRTRVYDNGFPLTISEDGETNTMSSEYNTNGNSGTKSPTATDKAPTKRSVKAKARARGSSSPSAIAKTVSQKKTAKYGPSATSSAVANQSSSHLMNRSMQGSNHLYDPQLLHKQMQSYPGMYRGAGQLGYPAQGVSVQRIAARTSSSSSPLLMQSQQQNYAMGLQRTGHPSPYYNAQMAGVTPSSPQTMPQRQMLLHRHPSSVAQDQAGYLQSASSSAGGYSVPKVQQTNNAGPTTWQAQQQQQQQQQYRNQTPQPINVSGGIPQPHPQQ